MAVVMAVIGIMASVAVPQFMRYLYRSKRTEAIYGLRTIHDLQLNYFDARQEYADSFELLGAPLSGGRINQDGSFSGDEYTFTLQTWEVSGKPNANYRATATGNIDPTDETLDIVIIENRITIID
jgi:type II secretory pathway pseudopilin PulG